METNEVLLDKQIRQLLTDRVLPTPITSKSLEGTKYAVVRRSVPTCDPEKEVAVQDGYLELGPNEKVINWTKRLKTEEELQQDLEARLMKG